MQRFIQLFCAIFGAGSVFGQSDESFRAAIAVAAVIIQHAGPNRLICGKLVLLPDRGVYLEALRVGVFLVFFIHFLPNHFRKVFRSRAGILNAAPGDKWLLLRELKLLVIEEIQFMHSAQDVKLALLRPLRVDYRVIK